MKQPTFVIAILISFLAPLLGDEITARIYTLQEVNQSGEVKELQTVIDDSLRPLIIELQKLQLPDFISAADAAHSSKWRLSRVVIISDDIVAMTFNEGHVIVTGVFVLDPSQKQWEIKTSVGGEFKDHQYDEQTGKPKMANKAEIATPSKPSD